MTDEQQEKFMGILGALSPENLHCDGEISRTAARRRERQLKAEWKTLERIVGHTVTEEEVFATYLKEIRKV